MTSDRPSTDWVPTAERMTSSVSQRRSFPACVARSGSAPEKGMERETGFEPATPCLEGRNSKPLSYSRFARAAMVLRRWQFAHTISHFATSAKIASVVARPTIRVTVCRLLAGSLWSKSMAHAS